MGKTCITEGFLCNVVTIIPQLAQLALCDHCGLIIDNDDLAYEWGLADLSRAVRKRFVQNEGEYNALCPGAEVVLVCEDSGMVQKTDNGEFKIYGKQLC